MNERIRFIDRWWLFEYSWHKWRIHRAVKRLNRASSAMKVHIDIIHYDLGVPPEKVSIQGLKITPPQEEQ